MTRHDHTPPMRRIIPPAHPAARAYIDRSIDRMERQFDPAPFDVHDEWLTQSYSSERKEQTWDVITLVVMMVLAASPFLAIIFWILGWIN